MKVDAKIAALVPVITDAETGPADPIIEPAAEFGAEPTGKSIDFATWAA